MLQQFIDNCPNATGNVKDCPAFAAVQNNDEPNACQFTGQVVDENIGLSGPLSALPGCNPTWNGDGAGVKPTCATQTTPGFKNSTLPLPSGWTDLGCIAEGTKGRALTGVSLRDANMTKASCVASCAARGFAIAGAEFGDVRVSLLQIPLWHI